MFHRVLLKISGEALSDTDKPLCFEKIQKTAQDIAVLNASGMELGVVVGGGNIMRGRNTVSQDRNTMDNMGMLATAINALALADALISVGVPAVVLSPIEMQRFCDSYSSRAAQAALKAGKVVVFACGTGCPYFSTDTAAALRSAEIGADALLLAKNIDAVYSADPHKDKNAVRIEHISYDEVIERKLQATDLTAITLCREQSIPILVFALDKLHAVAEGGAAGTLIDAK